MVAGRGAGAVEGEVVVSWCSDIAKTKSFLSQSWEREGVRREMSSPTRPGDLGMRWTGCKIEWIGVLRKISQDDAMGKGQHSNKRG